MLCDVLDRPVLVSLEPLASGLGAAICAGTGAGVFPGLAEGASRLSRLEQLTPNPERALRYRELSSIGDSSGGPARPPIRWRRASPCST